MPYLIFELIVHTKCVHTHLFVIRNLMTFKEYKVKHIHIIDCVIIGVVEGLHGSRITETQLSSCIVALRYKNGVYQVLNRVGGGLSDEKRTELWKSTDGNTDGNTRTWTD